MKAFVIERDIPGIGGFGPDELCGAARTSNAALSRLAPRVQWQHSWVTSDKTFCVYLAETEADIREHSKLSGIPCTRVIEVRARIDPTTGSDRPA